MPFDFRLRFKSPVTPEVQAELDTLANLLRGALDVDYREEVALAEAELREALVEWAMSGTSVDTDAIAKRFSERLNQLAP